MLRPVFFIIILCFGFLFGGFLNFVERITEPIMPDLRVVTDGIVVFTGGTDRVTEGVMMLKRGNAKRLLISGVHADTSANAIAQEINDNSPLFACCIDLGHDAVDTVGNAQETAEWANKRGYSSIRVVTASYHLPRSLVELKRHAPDLAVTPHPVKSNRVFSNYWWRHPNTTQFLFREYVKYLVSLLRWHTIG